MSDELLFKNVLGSFVSNGNTVAILRKWLAEYESQESKIGEITEQKEQRPKYIQDLLDNARIRADMTVLTTLNDVAIFIAKQCNVNITANHLHQFKNGKTGKTYSASAIRQAITAAMQ